jgi:hypothetical protein
MRPQNATTIPAILTVLLACAMCHADETRVTVQPNQRATTIGTYQISEWIIDPGRTYDNPFDPDQISIDATFTGPGGRQLVVPGFWSAPFQPQVTPNGTEHWVQTGPGQWLVRACLPDAGDWQMRVAARDKDGTRNSDPLTFHVDRSDSPGFIRRAPDNTRYLQFDSGAPYFAVGLNIGWPGRRGSADDEAWFARLAENGGNFARVWLCANRSMIESNKTGPGRYDLAASAYFDRVLRLAAERRIAVMLTFQNHSQLLDETHWGPGDWPRDAYNAANGGPATRPVNYFDPGPARTLFKRRLRYLVARYGAFTNVLAWELWNEQDLAKVPIPLDWTREMADELHRIDPYQHLVTTSFSGPGDKETWSLPSIDLTQRHLYGDEGNLHDTVSSYVKAGRENDAFGKPFLLAELGIAWQGPDSKYDPAGLGTNVRNGLWSAALAGGFGGGCTWWWDNYVAPQNVWPVYTGLARFAAQVDWPRRFFQPLATRRPRFPDTQPVTWGDENLPISPIWGKADGKPIPLDPDGELPADPLPGFLYGPVKKDLRVPTVLKVNLPNDCQLIVHVAEISQFAKLQIMVDGKPAGSFNFDARPNGKDHIDAKEDPKFHTWRAKFDRPCTVDLSAGPHEITLDNTAGDWLRLSAITLTRSRSSLVTDVRPLVLQDAVTGETLAWLQDVNSNWYADEQGLRPTRYENLTWSIPVRRPGTYRLDWWDTRAGRVVRSETIATERGEIPVRLPTFTRDIALRMTWEP